jgi:hypothetical protein
MLSSIRKVGKLQNTGLLGRGTIAETITQSPLPISIRRIEQTHGYSSVHLLAMRQNDSHEILVFTMEKKHSFVLQAMPSFCVPRKTTANYR